MALKAFQRPIILIAGGLDRGDDYTRLVADLKPHVKEVIVNGQTAAHMQEAAQAAGVKVVKDSRGLRIRLPSPLKTANLET